MSSRKVSIIAASIATLVGLFAVLVFWLQARSDMAFLDKAKPFESVVIDAEHEPGSRRSGASGRLNREADTCIYSLQIPGEVGQRSLRADAQDEASTSYFVNQRYLDENFCITAGTVVDVMKAGDDIRLGNAESIGQRVRVFQIASLITVIVVPLAVVMSLYLTRSKQSA